MSSHIVAELNSADDFLDRRRALRARFHYFRVHLARDVDGHGAAADEHAAAAGVRDEPNTGLKTLSEAISSSTSISIDLSHNARILDQM